MSTNYSSLAAAVQTLVNLHLVPADTAGAAANLSNADNFNVVIGGSFNAMKVGVALFESSVKSLPGAGTWLSSGSLINNLTAMAFQYETNGTIKAGDFAGAVGDLAALGASVGFGAAMVGAAVPVALTAGVGLSIISAALTVAAIHPDIADSPILTEETINSLSGSFIQWAQGFGTIMTNWPTELAATVNVMGRLGKLWNDTDRAIAHAVCTTFFGACAAPRSDPLTLDLDGYGIETSGINATAPVMFDISGSGVQQSVGWVGADDGFLVRDLNSNGLIDSGAELFGDATTLANGQKAADGFAALADLDSNHDGVVDKAINDFIWRRKA